jgi:cyanate permease
MMLIFPSPRLKNIHFFYRCTKAMRLASGLNGLNGLFLAPGAQLMLNIVVCGLGTGLFTLPWSVAGRVHCVG